MSAPTPTSSRANTTRGQPEGIAKVGGASLHVDDIPADAANKDEEQPYQEVKVKEEKPPIIDRPAVSAFFGGAVVVNSFFIGMDVQFRATEAGPGATTFMQLSEVVFLVIFGTELSLRVCADKCPKFLYDSWNLMDVVLVGSSAVDLVFSYLFTNDSAKDVQKLRLVRMIKITRLVRAVRVFRVLRFKWILRQMRGLIMMGYAIFSALRSLAWVALMFSVMNYLGAIITTEFIGLANEEGDEEIAEWFGDLFTSMFTLIQLATLEDWANVARKVGDHSGSFWPVFFLAYVLVANTIILNVVLATLIENVISLNEEVREAKAGELAPDDVEDWMLTPPTSESEEEEDEEGGGGGGEGGGGAYGGQNQQDREAMQALSEFFDLTATYIGIEGVNQRKLVTVIGLAEALQRDEVRNKVFKVCPELKAIEPAELSETIWRACPKPLDREGLTRQELAEACMAVKGELSMNHFVVISQAIQQLEEHVDRELLHLNKHQRKMNRRFLKMRHRLRKVYHFDGAPRKMVEMVSEMKRRNNLAATEAYQRGEKMLLPNGKQDGEDDSDVALSDGSSASEKEEAW